MNEFQRNPGRIRVACADDSVDLVMLYTAFIEQEADLESVASITHAHDIVPQVRATKPDVLLLDYSMPELDTEELIRTLTAELGELRIIVVSGYDDAETKDRVAAAGAWGLIAKQGNFDRVFDAVRQVAAGQRLF
jgi:DNA-binding NarL/FixJ family response regulator